MFAWSRTEERVRLTWTGGDSLSTALVLRVRSTLLQLLELKRTATDGESASGTLR